MSDHVAFVEAIAADPDDDAPRLVYADWLEERGDPHAELIRVQCERATMRWDDPRREQLQPRERRLVATIWAAWKLDRSRLRAQFHRGFIDRVMSDVREFPRHVDLWTRLAPTLDLVLTAVPVTPAKGPHDRSRALLQADYAVLATCPRLDRCTALALSGTMSVAGVCIILASPRLVRLRRLALHGTPLGGADLAALASSSAFERLTHLDLFTAQPPAAISRSPSAGLIALAASPRLSGLSSLSYRDPVTRAGAEALAASPYLAGLAELVLEDSLVDPPARQILQERFGDRVRFEDNIPF